MIAMVLALALAAMMTMADAGAGGAVAAAGAGVGGGAAPAAPAGKSFEDSAGEAFDKVNNGADDDEPIPPSGDAPTVDDAAQAADAGQKPPVKPVDPKPADPAPGQAGAFTPQQLQDYHGQLTSYHEQLQRITGDPLFQEAYEAAKAKAKGGASAGQGPQGSPGVPQAAPQPAAKPWQGFVPETDNEKALVGFLDQLQGQFDQRVGQLETSYGEKFAKHEERIGQMSSRSETVLNEKAQQAVDAAMGELKKDFPDLVDGGAKQKELEDEAAAQMQAAAQRGQRMTIPDALKRAARLTGWDGHEERTRQKLQKRAGASAGARVDAPGGHDGDLEPGAPLEKRLGAAYDHSAGG